MGQCPTSASKILILCAYFSIAILLAGHHHYATGEGMKCSGYCTKDMQKCQLRGGKVIGYCTKNLVCCDPLVSATGTCGDKKVTGQKVVFFKSPSFPEYAGGDLLCDFKVRIRNDSVAIRVDFLAAEMDGLSFNSGLENTAHCESDMIFIRGFNNWSPPARCGNLTGYGVLIDMDSRLTKNLGMLSVVALMSSSKYRFHIRVAQIMKPASGKPSIGKRSVTSNPEPLTTTTVSPVPTKVLIKTGKPAIFPRHTVDPNVESLYATDLLDGASFRTFDSEYPESKDWRSPSIVNGEDTLISTVPWQVSLRLKSLPEAPESEAELDDSDDNAAEEEQTTESYVDPTANCSETAQHFCGGSILSSRLIISASHCFFGSSKLDGMMNVSNIVVVLGDTNKCTDESEDIFGGGDYSTSSTASSVPRSYSYDVESITFHYAYDHSLLLNDVAILRLNQSIKYFDHVRPIALAQTGERFEGYEALVSGWGDRFTEGNSNNFSTEEPMGPNVLQSSRLLEIQNRSFCNQRDISQWGAPRGLVTTHPKYLYVFDSTLCTLTKNGSGVEVNTGRGDSGGPIVAFKNTTNGTQQPILVGITSYSIPFDENVALYDKENRTVDYFASVAFFRSWIDLVVTSFQQVGKSLK